MEQIGYSIVDGGGNEVQFWGTTAGECVSAPAFIDWPSGDRTFCPSVGASNNGAKYVARMLAQSTGDPASETVAFNGTQVVVTRVVLAPPPVNLVAYANAKQWALAMGGYVIAFDGGPTVPFDTSDIGLTLINGKISRLAQADPPASFNWQSGPTTFVTLTAAQIVQAGVAIADFVQATFDTLNTVFAGITGNTITTTEQIDAAGWPSNS
jgi:hypothetical protein